MLLVLTYVGKENKIIILIFFLCGVFKIVSKSK